MQYRPGFSPTAAAQPRCVVFCLADGASDTDHGANPKAGRARAWGPAIRNQTFPRSTAMTASRNGRSGQRTNDRTRALIVKALPNRGSTIPQSVVAAILAVPIAGAARPSALRARIIIDETRSSRSDLRRSEALCSCIFRRCKASFWVRALVVPLARDVEDPRLRVRLDRV